MKLALKIALGLVATLAVVLLGWLWVLPSFAVSMQKNAVVQLPVQLPVTEAPKPDVTITIRAPGRYLVGDKEIGLEALRAALSGQPRPPRVLLVGGPDADFEAMRQVLDLLRTTGIEKVSVSTAVGEPVPVGGHP